MKSIIDHLNEAYEVNEVNEASTTSRGISTCG